MTETLLLLVTSASVEGFKSLLRGFKKDDRLISITFVQSTASVPVGWSGFQDIFSMNCSVLCGFVKENRFWFLKAWDYTIVTPREIVLVLGLSKAVSLGQRVLFKHLPKKHLVQCSRRYNSNSPAVRQYATMSVERKLVSASWTR